MSTAPPVPSYVSLGMLLGIEEIALDEMFWQKACELRVAVPASVVSFNPGPPQTVTVQPAIQENIFQNLVPTPMNLPQLPDIPIAVYGAGSFVITLPIQAGDECLVVFADMCINRWRIQGVPSSGPVANQEERRRHDLSDGIAIFGLWSNPRGISGYSSSDLQIRSLNSNVVIDVSSTQITLTPDGGTTQVVIKAGEIDLIATTVKINGRTFLLHEHSGVATGSANSGGVV